MILSGRQIKEYLDKERWAEKLVIAPRLEQGSDVADDAAGVDVRLGQQFLVSRTADVRCVDPRESDKFEAQLGRSQQQVYVPVGESFMLHPGRFALGCTLEYVRLPYCLGAYVIGRSSWARVGLVIAMATAVHPGFAGVLTLELQNLGDVPLALYPGSRVAQLIFHTTGLNKSDVVSPPDTYSCQTGPGQTALHRDREWSILRAIRDAHNDAAAAQDGCEVPPERN